jgi:hypothetical protein
MVWIEALGTRDAVIDDAKAVIRRIMHLNGSVKNETRDVIAGAERAVAADRDTQCCRVASALAARWTSHRAAAELRR